MGAIIGQGISVSPVADAVLSHDSTSTVQNKVVSDAIATEYSTSKTYHVGDVCTHDGKLYECIVEITTAEGWTSAHWKESSLGDAVTSLNQAINVLDAEVNDSTTGLDTKAPAIINTASGAIASFADGADGMPVKKLVVNVEPQQDLHGYDAPWPAGGGKNKLKALQSGTGSSGGITYTVNSDGSITLNGTSTENFTLYIVGSGTSSYGDAEIPTGEYKMNGIPTNVDASLYCVEKDGETVSAAGGQDKTVTINSEATYRIFIRVGNGKTVTNATVYPMIRPVADTDPTFAPYSNICPISGWTGAEIERTGKNLIDNSSAAWENNGINSSGDNATASDQKRTKSYYSVKASKQISISGIVAPSTTSNVRIFFYDRSKTFIKYTNYLSTWSVPENAEFFRLRTPVDMDISLLQIEYGSTATAYEPFQSDQISVTFPTSAGTVYGGTLTINPDRTGQLTVEYVKKAITQFAGIWPSTNPNGVAVYATVPETIHAIELINPDMMASNIFKYSASSRTTMQLYCYGGNNGGVTIQTFILPSTITTLAEANAWLADNPAECTFGLGTPLTYQLTESEIDGILTTLYGTNNIWSDAGDVSVEYPCDTRLYIDNKITQAIAAALNA